METPPPNNQSRTSNPYGGYRQITPNSIQKFSEYKKAKQYKYFQVKDNRPKTKEEERKYIQQKMKEMSKNFKYLEESNWMFENKQGMNPIEQLPKGIWRILECYLYLILECCYKI